MTATGDVRFSADGTTTVKSYLRLTASTRIQCCLYDDAAPILTLYDGPVDITITTPAQGEVTADDVTFGRQLADAVVRYAADLENKLTAQGRAAADPDGRAGQAA